MADAPRTKQKDKRVWYRNVTPPEYWHQVSHEGAKPQFKLAEDKAVTWMAGIGPGDKSASALA